MLFAYPIRLDLEVSHALQYYHPVWLTHVAKGISFMGSPLFVTLLGVALASRWLLTNRRTEVIRLILVLSGNILTAVLKPAFGRDRPMPGFVFALFNESSFSFPSGHALCAMLIGGYLWLMSSGWPAAPRRVMRLVAVVFVLAIGWSRIYLGVHWLTDVVAGYLFGFFWLVLVIIIWPYIKRAMVRKS